MDCWLQTPCLHGTPRKPETVNAMQPNGNHNRIPLPWNAKNSSHCRTHWHEDTSTDQAADQPCLAPPSSNRPSSCPPQSSPKSSPQLPCLSTSPSRCRSTC